MSLCFCVVFRITFAKVLPCASDVKYFAIFFYFLAYFHRQAEKLAEYKAFQMGGVPLLNAFDFDENLLADGSLKVLHFDEYSKEWADFIFSNRNSATGYSTHDYDIVIGPIANDRVGVQFGA